MTLDVFNQDQLYERKKAAILKTAASCFNELGYGGTSLKSLANRLNLTDAALYYYVKSKEELIFLCYDRAMDLGEIALTNAIAESENGLGALDKFIRYGIDAMVGDDGPVAVVSEIASLGPKYRDRIQSRAIAHTKRVTELIERGIADGSIAPCNARLSCDVVLGAIGWIAKWYHKDRGYSGDEVKEAFTATLLLGLKPR